MEFRNIVVSNPARISLRHGQLCIAQEQEVLIPLEDICTLMLESRQALVSSAALEALAVQGVTVFLCDAQHLPSAQLLAFNQFSRKKKMLRAQIDLGRPLQKQLWRMIVRRKIQNQAACLRLLNCEGADVLNALADTVRSGDTGNAEAVAAAAYFTALFGQGFTRGVDCLENAMLNYGYAILRGAIARNLVMHGLEPCLGLFHRNELNPYNLADDLIEPYRPLVDLFVGAQQNREGELTPERKRALFNLTNNLVLQKGKRYRVMTSIDRSAASLAASIEMGKNLLELPELIPLEEGGYE